MRPKPLTKSEISKRLSFSDDSEEESSDSGTKSSDQNDQHGQDQGNKSFAIFLACPCIIRKALNAKTAI